MTVRSPLWDALAIGAAFLLIGGVTGGFAAALACIGTLDREARPVLAARGWLAAKEAAAMAWWHAHRLPVLGLLYPQRGRRAAGGEWHPLDEEDNDGQPAETPARGRQPRAEEDDLDREAQEAGQEDRAPAAQRGPDDLRGHHDDWAGGRLTYKGEDDLTGLSAEDTDTLNAIRAINAEHLVPPHEPAAGRYCESGCGCRYGTDDPDRLDCACDGPCCCAEHDEWFGPGCTYHDEPAEPPETSGPGGLPGATPPAPAATGQPGPEAGPPGPASAGGPPFAPVTTASCAAEDIAAKGDSTGPGAIIICGECPSGRPPAAGPGPDQLSRLISGYLGAAEAMLPAWGQLLACSMRRELTAGAP